MAVVWLDTHANFNRPGPTGVVPQQPQNTHGVVVTALSAPIHSEVEQDTKQGKALRGAKELLKARVISESVGFLGIISGLDLRLIQ